MTTQTLKNPAPPIVTLVAPPIESKACQRLQKSLSDYQAVLAELEQYRGKASRVQADEDKLLGDCTLSEEASLQRLTEFSARKALYGSRITGAEGKSADLLTEFKEALAAAMVEVNRRVTLEIEKQRESIIERVCVVLGVTDDSLVRGEIMRLTRVAPAILALERLMPGSVYSVKDLPPAGVVLTAETVLKNAAKLEDL
jgi:hypothetical protein